jgi:hypothetical protein
VPKVDSIPCPACGDTIPIRIGKTKGKPYLKCECGFVGHATKEKAIRAFSGDGPVEPAKEKQTPPRKGGGKEEKTDEWDQW